MLDKEIKKNPALIAMLGTEDKDDTVEKEEVVKEKKTKKTAKEKNPKGYIRNRGKDGSKPMSYYLPDDIIRLLNIKAAKEGKTKSELVLAGLKLILKDEIKEMKSVPAQTNTN